MLPLRPANQSSHAAPATWSRRIPIASLTRSPMVADAVASLLSGLEELLHLGLVQEVFAPLVGVGQPFGRVYVLGLRYIL